MDRVLKPDGFVVLFGRGTSFYRWNVKLAELGYTFKEEVIWEKRNITSPVLPLGRIHETISIYTKGKGCIRKQYVDYIEKLELDPEGLKKALDTINKIKNGLGDIKRLESMKKYLETGVIPSFDKRKKEE